MIKLEQKGFTLVEMLISIGILGIGAPLLALALFQILTFTERARSGFEAQADTRNAAAWISQDIVMAQATGLTPTKVTNPDCASPPVPTADFTWTDKYKGRDHVHTVSYCVRTDPAPPLGDPVPECPIVSPCLVRNYIVTKCPAVSPCLDSDRVTTRDDSNVIAKNIVSVDFSAKAVDRPPTTLL